ncbi:hypothetical protein [uncultured Roseibium sp.]|uniref:hypothetical protein n=1 Tax=uncultured Roseibium sp. TaxID=1936171 RepID=UPI00261A0074|nr:hypothetical protein [uncultured Roseibium sp.]
MITHQIAIEQLTDHIATLADGEQVFGPSRALQQFGSQYHPKNDASSLLRRGAAKSCYANATSYALRHNNLFYSEGYALDPALPVPLQHAWLVDEVGEVIETSGRIVVVGSNGYKMGDKRIRFEDLNFDNNYSAWNAYAQSKLAQMVFAYELQRRVQKAGKTVQVHVCHPGASRTGLIRDTADLKTRILATLLLAFAQSAARGSWPEVMCATEKGLEAEKYYGPTRFEMVGPVGECALEAFALEPDQAAKLWTLSEQKTALSWTP